MSNGLNPKLHLAIVIALAVSGFVFLSTRPKVVIKSEVQADRTEKKDETVPSTDKAHILSEEAKIKLNEIRNDRSLSGNQALLNNRLAGVFLSESAFDSAGYYFEKAAVLSSDINSWVMAGDAYLQAFNMSFDPKNMEVLVEKTRSCYNKVLSIEPQNLHAKTNLAMTYVRSDSPMKAISMLREVLDENPEYIPAMMSLGGLSMESGQYDKAVQRFESVLKIDPNNTNAMLGKAYSFIELGKKSEAKLILSELLKKDIDPVMKDEMQKTLNSLK